MFDLPPYVFAFIFAAIAALAARFLVGPVRDDAGSFPGWILYAVAVGFVVAGLADLWIRSMR
jgi:hypothetical protein